MTTPQPAARRRISSGAVWEPIVGYSRAVRVGPWVAVSGTTTVLEGDEPVGGDDIAEQARTAIGVLTRALTEAGASLEDVIRTRMFVTDISRWEELAAVHGEVFGDIRPATSMVQVTALIHPRLLVEIEADAFITTPTSSASS
jgi:enamine deaminase RidA (YjgF/YER057c/UK114 family)